jgi:hypothetical protein
MAYVLIIVGSVLLISGVKDTTQTLFGLLSKDLATHNSYLSWMFAILVIGAIGYIQELRPFSRTFMALVLVVLFLRNGGFFTQFQKEFSSLSSDQSQTTNNTTIVQLPSIGGF